MWLARSADPRFRRRAEPQLTLQTMQEMASEYHVEEFPEAELLVNITKHFLVPKHQIMAPSEKAELIKK